MSKKRVMSFLLVILAFMVFLSACGSGGTTETTTSTPSQTQQKEFDPENVTKRDPFEKFNPVIDLVTVMNEMPHLTFEPGDSVDNSVWTRAYERDLGIRVSNMWVVDPSQRDQRTDLMIASGDIADVFQVNRIQFQQLIDNDMIQDISKAYLEFVSDDAARILTEGGPFAIDAATRNGKLMGIPFTGNQLEGVSLMWIRTDWLDKLGLSVPKNQAELEDMMIAFAKEDPNGTGRADTHSMLLTRDAFKATSHADALFYSYGAFPNTWYDDGTGNLVWGGIQSQVKEGLAAFKRLFDAGAIDKEFITFDMANAREALISDRVGMIYEGYYGSGGQLQLHVEATGLTEVWQAYPMVSVDGSDVKLPHETETYGFHVVRKGFGYPEAAVKMLNMWIQEFYINTTDNDRYLELVQNETGTNAKWGLSLCQAYRPLNNINNFRLLEKWQDTGDKSFYDQVTYLGKSFYNGGIRFRDNNEISQWFWWVMHCPEYDNPAMRITSKNIEKGNLKPNLFYGVPTATMVDTWNMLREKQAEAYQLIISGDPIDNFDRFVTEWKSLGGEQITKEVNEWYKDHKDAEENVYVKMGR